MSDDGSVVVFQSNFQLVPGDTNNASDIYVWHRASGNIELITLPGGLAADGVDDGGGLQRAWQQRVDGRPAVADVVRPLAHALGDAAENPVRLEVGHAGGDREMRDDALAEIDRVAAELALVVDRGEGQRVARYGDVDLTRRLELAERVGMSPTSLSKRLAGAPAIDMNEVEALAVALGLSPFDLMDLARAERAEPSAA